MSGQRHRTEAHCLGGRKQLPISGNEATTERAIQSPCVGRPKWISLEQFFGEDSQRLAGLDFTPSAPQSLQPLLCLPVLLCRKSPRSQVSRKSALCFYRCSPPNYQGILTDELLEKRCRLVTNAERHQGTCVPKGRFHLTPLRTFLEDSPHRFFFGQVCAGQSPELIPEFVPIRRFLLGHLEHPRSDELALLLRQVRNSIG